MQGLDLTEINMAVLQKIKEQSGEYGPTISLILDAVAEAVAEEDDFEINFNVLCLYFGFVTIVV